MTATARIVLADCLVSLSLLENESELKIWRVHWVGALSILRAVGVDGSKQ